MRCGEKRVSEGNVTVLHFALKPAAILYSITVSRSTTVSCVLTAVNKMLMSEH